METYFTNSDVPVNARRILRVCPTNYAIQRKEWPLLRLEEAEDVERECRRANARAYVRQTGGVKLCGACLRSMAWHMQPGPDSALELVGMTDD